jgi:hypothetical protein
MIACAIAYMFKNLSLKDWLIYSERFGMPIPIGETSAPKDSPEWIAMLDAVQSIMAGSAAVKNVGEQITLLETKGPGRSALREADRAARPDHGFDLARERSLDDVARGAAAAGRERAGRGKRHPRARRHGVDPRRCRRSRGS